MNTKLLRRSSQAFLLASGLVLAACTTAPPEPQPVVTAPAPVQETMPPPPPPPLYIPARPVDERMGEPLIRAAGNHAVLMGHIHKTTNGSINTPEHMNQTMDGLSQVFSPGIGPAFIGYGALIGAQNSQFAEGVIETARYQGLDTVVYQLYVDPDYAASLPGAELASGEIQNAWASDVASIGRSAARMKEQSYSLQKQSKWKKLRTDSRAERLEAVSRAQSVRFNPPTETTRQIAQTGTIREGDLDGPQKRQSFWQVFGHASPPQTETFSNQYKRGMHRKALTLSALEILGATGSDSSEWIENYMTSPRLTQCVNTARLNTEQCIAAGHFKYEDAFCIAEHELKEISDCLAQSTL
ncbi:MAG: hypothetical protein JKY25_07390 [Robiginitomaculum sp.]|nr:hypothetical protein [Robiginitomaculum sp.]